MNFLTIRRDIRLLINWISPLLYRVAVYARSNTMGMGVWLSGGVAL